MKRTRWSVLLLLILPALACRPSEELAEPAATRAAPSAQWQCHNDVEISCEVGRCEAADRDSFTPMAVRFDAAGSMSVCAYSGCWEGTGTVVKREPFIVLTGHDLPFSTAADSAARRADIAIVLDREDEVAILKAGAFAHPLRCEKSPAGEG